jgi:hypothetical protein
VRKIESLTAEQKAKFPEYVRRWTEIGLSTEVADRPRAEAAMVRMYEIAGLKPPRIVWCGSPLSMALTRAVLLKVPETGASVRDSVRASVRDSVWASVRDSVGASVLASVRDSVGASVYGQHEAGWLSFYSFFREAVSLTSKTDNLDGLFQLAMSAGWAIPHANICWVSERHHILSRNDRGLLHSIVGPAVAYPDGWKIYAVNGIRVKETWITHTSELTASDVFKEQNAEVRRAGCELIGWDRVLSGIDARLIDDDGDPFIGTLYEGQIPGAKPCGFLKVRCGTKREFVIPVEAGLGTAIAAQAWIQNVAPSKWTKPEVRG